MDKRILKMDSCGSATIEAALLIPLILSVVMMLIYLSLFLYNRTAAVSLAGQAMVLGAGMENEGAKKIGQSMNAFLHEGEKHLPLVKSVETSADVSLTGIKAGIDLTGRMNGFFLPGAASEPSYSYHGRVERLDPAGYIWKIRIAKQLGSGGKSKIKEEQ